MSAKKDSDEKKADYPWTARQRRQKAGKRQLRKQVRRQTRNK